jgi:hypothetical protein
MLTSSAALHGGFPVAVRLEKVQYSGTATIRSYQLRRGTADRRFPS